MKLHEFSRDFVGRCMADQDAFGVLRALCEEVGPRVSGSAEEARATEMVLSRLAACGCETALEPFGYPGWRAGASALTAWDRGVARVVPCSPLGWCPGGRVRAPIVDVGCGMGDDYPAERVRGKIVLVSSDTTPGQRALHRSEKYAFAVAAGASGFVHFDKRLGGLAAMGSIDLEGRMGKIPAVGVSYEEALRLRSRQDGLTVEISSGCRGEKVVSHNGAGLKRGHGAGELIVCGHIDSWFSPGAVDNGSGVAMVAELARLLAPYKLTRSVRFVTFGSEELGLLGSKAYVRDHGDLSSVACVFNLDCTAIRDGTLGATTNESPRLQAFLREIAGQLHLDLRLNPETLRYSDHYPFREKGVPGVAFMSGGSTYGYGHTACDTLDKVSPEAFTIPLVVVGVAVIECAMQEIAFGPDGASSG